MTFRITGLDPAPFQRLHALTDAQLAQENIKRVRISDYPAAPCRISLDDVEKGGYALLLSHEHQPARTAYRQQGPIFISDAAARFDEAGVIPPALARRPLSLRGFDEAGVMIEADLVEGSEARRLIECFFANPEVAYIHAHYARRGCFAAAITRA